MASPLQSSPTSIFTGSTGNPLIDAMLITVETLKVMVAQRATVVGETVVKWGGPFGTGANLTYSFITASSVFASDTGPEKTGIVEMQEGLRQHFRNAFAQWSNIANVTFQEVVETATTAGDIRIGVTTVGVAPGGASAVLPVFLQRRLAMSGLAAPWQTKPPRIRFPSNSRFTNWGMRFLG